MERRDCWRSRYLLAQNKPTTEKYGGRSERSMPKNGPIKSKFIILFLTSVPKSCSFSIFTERNAFLSVISWCLFLYRIFIFSDWIAYVISVSISGNRLRQSLTADGARGEVVHLSSYAHYTSLPPRTFLSPCHLLHYLFSCDHDSGLIPIVLCSPMGTVTIVTIQKYGRRHN